MGAPSLAFSAKGGKPRTSPKTTLNPARKWVPQVSILRPGTARTSTHLRRTTKNFRAPSFAFSAKGGKPQTSPKTTLNPARKWVPQVSILRPGTALTSTHLRRTTKNFRAPSFAFSAKGGKPRTSPKTTFNPARKWVPQVSILRPGTARTSTHLRRTTKNFRAPSFAFSAKGGKPRTSPKTTFNPARKWVPHPSRFLRRVGNHKPHPKPPSTQHENGCPILRAFCEGWETTNLTQNHPQPSTKMGAPSFAFSAKGGKPRTSP